MLVMTRTSPEDGDIVVARLDTEEPGQRYGLHVAPGPDVAVFETQERALFHALAFAQIRRVRIWLNDGGHEFALINDFRVLRCSHDEADTRTASR